jgi:hypothetical protein
MRGGNGAVDHGLAGLGQGTAEQSSGGADLAGGRGGAHAQPVAEPAGGGGSLDAVFGAGRPAGIHRGEFLEPVAFQAVQQPPQRQHLFGGDGVGQAVQVLGGQLVNRRGQGGQRIPGARSTGWSGARPSA